MTGISAMTSPMTSTRQDDSPSRPQIFAISNEATASQINESQDTVISEEESNIDVPALIQVSASSVLWICEVTWSNGLGRGNLNKDFFFHFNIFVIFHYF